MNDDIFALLNNARGAIAKGDVKTAQQILAGVLNQDSKNVEAWLLLSDIVETSQQRIDCLNRVLQINPNNEIARGKLGYLPTTKVSTAKVDEVKKRENINPLLVRNMVIIGIAIAIIGGILVAGIFAIGTIYPNSGVVTSEFYFYLLIFSCLLIPCGGITTIAGFVMGQNQKRTNEKQTNKSASIQATPLTEKTIEQRREVLQKHIYAYISQGYRVVSQTDTTAQMVKPKQFSLLAALFWLFVFVIGLLIYIFYFMASSDQQIYLEVDLYGQVKILAT